MRPLSRPRLESKLTGKISRKLIRTERAEVAGLAQSAEIEPASRYSPDFNRERGDGTGPGSDGSVADLFPVPSLEDTTIGDLTSE